MSSPQNPAEPADLPEDLYEENEYYNEVCDDLIAMAHDMARQIHDAFDPRQIHNQVNAFNCLARIIRRTILLSRHLAHPRPGTDRKSPPVEPPETVEHAERPETVERAEHVERLERPESLHCDLRAIADIQRDIATRPIPEIIAEIRQDLGLDPSTPPEPSPEPPDPLLPALRQNLPPDLRQNLRENLRLGTSMAGSGPSAQLQLLHRPNAPPPPLRPRRSPLAA